jgi:hypothetical protein
MSCLLEGWAMKYTVEIEVNAPLKRAVELFDEPGSLRHWMPVASVELLSGAQGHVGAQSLIKFKNGARETHMTETVLVRDLPREFSASYAFQGVHYVVKNHFEETAAGRTRYWSEQDFQLTGFMKVFGLLVPWMFRRESMKHLRGFKAYVEAAQ